MQTRTRFILQVTAALLAVCTSTTHAQPLIGALQESTPHGDFRLRYETVDDSVNRDAEALTLRSRLGMSSGELHGFSLLAEFVDVRILGGIGDFAPRRNGYAVIADPATTEVNRAAIRYRHAVGIEAGIGRQRIIFDNARFIGNVGWRQNEQTFDSLTVQYRPGGELDLSYAYLDHVRGITSSQAATYRARSHLLNFGWTTSWGRLGSYAYLLKNRDSGAELDTFGARFAGEQPVAGVNLRYLGEYAWQEATIPNRGDFSARYLRFEAGVFGDILEADLIWESLGSDGGAYGFDTPLATKHAFNGWSDRFLATPDNGLRDLQVRLAANLAGIRWIAAHHWFDADRGSARHGRELNLQASRPFGRHYVLGAKYARYQARDFGSDTRKFWLWAELTF